MSLVCETWTLDEIVRSRGRFLCMFGVLALCFCAWPGPCLHSRDLLPPFPRDSTSLTVSQEIESFQLGEVVRCIVHTILFNRCLGPLRPLEVRSAAVAAEFGES